MPLLYIGVGWSAVIVTFPGITRLPLEKEVKCMALSGKKSFLYNQYNQFISTVTQRLVSADYNVSLVI